VQEGSQSYRLGIDQGLEFRLNNKQGGRGRRVLPD
jgi:hypothetical protein